ncbi:methyltransferase type 11 [Leucosporidium creatinivorum]|uniref:Methyltransferase type 11 n=1 Tax=Leucosporidium creatinivorum TaxID=106004 RepID=A0A1Y2EM46_9BASI|nr:methyltransferase type 11 [Leucosporidium creatinivorum]
MFSGASTPPKATRTPRRAGTRASRAAIAASGETTPRASPPPSTSASLHRNRSLGHNLHAASRALSASPAPSLGSRRTRSVAAASEAGSAMDLDERERATKGEEDKVLVKDESYVVLEKKGLPAEVEQVIRAADPYTDPFRATLDSQTGFALLVSREHCFVWNWAKRSTSSTTYVFPLPATPPLPTNITAFAPLSYASFVPSSSPTTSQREPGLLSISTLGAIRYWESISMALSGVERFKALDAPLSEGELVRGFKMLSPTSYLASTSQARLILVTISSVGGRVAVNARPLERSVGWAGSVWSAVFGGRQADPRAGVLALALSPANSAGEGKSWSYALTEKDVQVWEMPSRDDGGERLAVEQDVFAGVLEALSGEKVTNEDWAMNSGKVEIVDAVVVPSSGNLAVLISHITPWTAFNYTSYAIVLLEVGSTQNSVSPIGVRHLAYQARPDPRPLSSPKLSLAGGETAFVTFVDAVVMLSLAAESSFEESFPLRSNTHRFLGVSTPSAPLPSGLETLSLLTSTSTILAIQVSPPALLASFAPGSEGYKTRKLKTKIEQAIFFGASDVENPLAFDLQPDFEGDLISATEAVSAEILASSSTNMPLILDLRAQLADRVQRSRTLIEYINGNGLLPKLSQSSRRQLSWDAERLAAAVAVWHHLNSRLGTNESLLADSISAFMSNAGDGLNEDPLRTFFRTKVASLGAVVEQVSRSAKAFISDSTQSSDSRSIVLQEANHVLITVYTAVARHRRDTATHYGLDPSVLPTEPWSSRPIILDGLQWHFESTDALLRERVRDFGTSLEEEQAKFGALDLSNQQTMQGELKKQMASLAEFVFSAFEERILYLHTSTEGLNSPDTRSLTERYLTLRSRFLRTLVTVGKVNQAYELAERHRDFRALVELCNHPQHGSLQRIQFFMDKYREEFAFSLYQFYIEKDQLRVLLEQDDAYRPLLTSFLDSTDNPHISWINDIAIGRFGNATDALVGEAVKEQSLAQKKLMLSLGKLSQVAQSSKETLFTEGVQRAIEVVDDKLDLVNSQVELKENFNDILSGSENRLSLEEKSEIIAARVAPILADRPAFAQLYARLVNQLLQGQSLSPEDHIDLLTLKENVGDQSGDFASALEILQRAKEIPDARRQIMVQAIWRRVYLRDDWASLRAAVGLKDEELAGTLRSTALFSTLAAAAASSLPDSLYLEPGHSLFTGSAEEIAARLPDLPDQFIEALLGDFETENRELLEAIQQHGLDSFATEINRLLQEGTTGDVAMAE